MAASISPWNPTASGSMSAKNDEELEDQVFGYALLYWLEEVC